MTDRKLSTATAQSVMLPKVEGFENIEYYLRITGTSQYDKRVMTFVDNLWGFEVTGGRDQYEYLTIISVKRTGLARRAGMRVGDKISTINDIDADHLTLREAQELISKSGRQVKIVVRGEDVDSDDDCTADLWYKPLSPEELARLHFEERMRMKRLQNLGKWNDEFPWNDRKRPIYRESNCFLVRSKTETKRQRTLHMKYMEEQEMKFRAGIGYDSD